MKKIAFILVTLGMAATALAGEPSWQLTLPEAADQARQEHKLLLLDFTGSDWCGWCKKLDADTFSQPAFIDYANKYLVLVQLDYPRQKAQSEQLKEANRALQQKYGVNGFPTVMLINPDGAVLWKQTGYAPGGPSAMIAAINKSRGLPAPAKVAAPVAAVPYQRPAPPPRKPGDEPKLQGILYSPSHSSAVIDGVACEEGDTVHGVRLVKIARDSVTVDAKGQVKVLRMN